MDPNLLSRTRPVLGGGLIPFDPLHHHGPAFQPGCSLSFRPLGRAKVKPGLLKFYSSADLAWTNFLSLVRPPDVFHYHGACLRGRLRNDVRPAFGLRGPAQGGERRRGQSLGGIWRGFPRAASDGSHSRLDHRFYDKLVSGFGNRYCLHDDNRVPAEKAG